MGSNTFSWRTVFLLLLPFIVLSIYSDDCQAQDLKWNEDLYPDTVAVDIGPLKNNLSLMVGLDGEANLVFELDYHRMFRPFFGIGGGYFLYTQWGSVSLPCGDMESSPTRWSSETKERAIGLKFSCLLSPTFFKNHKWNFNFDFKPALLLNFPLMGHSIRLMNINETRYTEIDDHGNDWLFFDTQLGFTFIKNQRYGYKIAYSCTNCDIYSNSRDIVYQGTSFNDFFPDKHTLVHRVLIGFTFLF